VTVLPLLLAALVSESSVPTKASADTILTVEELARELGPGGDAAMGREGLRALAARATAREATLWIQLLSVVERVGTPSAAAAVRAVGLAIGGEAPEGAESLVGFLESSPEEDRATLLALAALLAEEEEPLRAGELRHEFLEMHSDAPEMPELALRHARWLVSIEARREEGVRLLEELIVQVPEHPVIPEARRIYQVERGVIGPGGGS
jgi:hypothetical protein